MRFIKYQALGNDYIVLDSLHAADLSESLVRAVCDRHYGIGSDGILVLRSITDDSYVIGIFNPDGSEAEKSGNGLRIFARYLWDEGFAANKQFSVTTPSDKVTCHLREDGTVTVEMGRASFASKDVPVQSGKDEVVRESIQIGEERLEYTALSMGNPHCVILAEGISEEKTRGIGPLLENHSLFPNRINVQFVEPLDKNNVRMEIWERGAGYTRSSGSSASAAACVVRRLGICEKDIRVHMPGGVLEVTVSEDFRVTISGEVERVADGAFSTDFIDRHVRVHGSTNR